jgi:hypothetical protein
MALKLPGNTAARIAGNVDAVQYEVAQEMAASLRRAADRLDAALGALHAHDAADREGLLHAAGQALWYYVVQREACGFRDSESLMRELNVPREVQLRMGVPRRG